EILFLFFRGVLLFCFCIKRPLIRLLPFGHSYW
uniref:Uncharacterized protein n=1 Tax=Aegilops tauschii subsp. strangulata TaxID=200361 RepID=A0A453JYT8_AEGTS